MSDKMVCLPGKAASLTLSHKQFTAVFLMSWAVDWASSAKPHKEWLDKLVPDNYSSDLPPLGNGNESTTGPAKFYCILHPFLVASINMRTMDFDVDMRVTVEWHDPRLPYREYEKYIKSTTHVPLAVAETLWIPVFLFENLKGRKALIITPDDILIGPLFTDAAIIYKNGIRVIYRKTLRFICDLTFVAYPFDTQCCEAKMYWFSGHTPFLPVTLLLTSDSKFKDISVPPGFLLTSFTIKDGITNNAKYPSGNIFTFHRKSLVFEFKRVYSQHLMLIFMPSILIVMLSWVSFWLDVQAAAPRVALGITTLLTLSTQFNAAQKNLPPVSYIKALDIWMFTCLFMVFASLVEFAVAEVCRRLTPVTKPPIRALPQHVFVPRVVSDEGETKPRATDLKNKVTAREKFSLCCSSLHPRHAASRIDYGARIFFPFAFLFFNVIFWNHFLQ